ncbi:MAG: hypothetical protein IJM57_03155 [Lachnospiraceae bacterium]|nr:hypothetical protein [Lachnospiraceae bacterium]
MKAFTKLALLAAAVAGGCYLYKEVTKQKQLAEGDYFEDDEDIFEDEPIEGVERTCADGEETEEAEEEASASRYESIKNKASDVAHKAKDKAKDIAAVVSEKATSLAQATKEKAVELKERFASKEESAEEAVEEVAEDAAEAADDWTGSLEDAAEKVDDIAVDMADAVDPD